VVIYGFDVTIGLMIWQMIPSQRFPLLSSAPSNNIDPETIDENKQNPRTIILNLIQICLLDFIWPILDIIFRLIFLTQIVYEFNDPLLGDFANFESWAILFFIIIPIHSIIMLGLLIYRLISLYHGWIESANDSRISTILTIFKKIAKAERMNRILNWLQGTLYSFSTFCILLAAFLILKYLNGIEVSWIISAFFSILFISLITSKLVVENLGIGQGYA